MAKGDINKSEVSKRLSHWHEQIDRQLPWKKDKDPYKIWLSEIIMQQTRVEQGTPYYLKFIKKYPTIIDLANADESEVLRMWQGLGYYSRARNLHAAAIKVRDTYNGVFPKEYKEILSLKGVGEYTASAIASFAFGQQRAVVDGNVIRFISRLFGISAPIDISETKKQIQHIADLLIAESDPASHNQAMMDFGSLGCKPRSPECPNCIFNDVCKAHKEDLVEVIPLKVKKIKKRTRYLHFLCIQDQEGSFLITKRSGKDIWKGLYQIPLVETDSNSNDIKEKIERELKQTESRLISLTNSKPFKHILSHQTLWIRIYEIEVDKLTEAQSHFKIRAKDIDDYGFPVPLVNYFKKKF